MPEDIIEEVSEQITEEVDDKTASTEEKPETVHDESSAFDADDTDLEKAEDDGFEQEEEPEKKAEEIKEEPESPEDKEEDEDEDVLRGKELLAEAEEATQKEEQEKLEAEKETEVEKKDSFFTYKYNPGDAGYFDSIYKDSLPKNAELPDGTELDFDGFLKADPELPFVVASIVTNMVNTMIERGDLVTSADHNKVYQDIDNKLFSRSVTNEVKNVSEIDASEDFKTWLKNEPPEIQTLRKSGDPGDHVRLYKRFIGQAGKDKADEKIADLDKKRKAKKEKFDSVHKTTVKNKRSAMKTSAVSRKEEEAEGFEDGPDDDDII